MQQAFANSPNFNTLVLSSNARICNIYVDTFAGTQFNNGNANLYVPNALIENYLAAPNWSTILSYPNVNILPIEGSPYEIV